MYTYNDLQNITSANRTAADSVDQRFSKFAVREAHTRAKKIHGALKIRNANF